MPTIKPYEQQVNAPGAVDTRRATAADFSGGLENLQTVGKGLMEVGEMVADRKEQTEVSDLTAKFAKLQAERGAEWQEELSKADPGDKEVAKRFIDKVKGDFDEMGAEFQTRGGQNFFKNQSAQMLGHFTKTAIAGQVELAGVKAREDYTSSINNLTSGLIADPSSYEQSKALHKAGLEAAVASGLDRKLALQLETDGRTQLAKSAVEGWSRLDPEGTKKDLLSGRWDSEVSGDVKRQLIGRADEEIRGREVEAARQRAEQKRILEEKQTEAENGLLDGINKGSVNARKVLDSILDPDKKRIYLNMLETMADKPPKTNHRLFNETVRKINLPDGDPDKITDEKVLLSSLGKGLNFEDVNKLRGEMQGRKTIAGRMESDVKNQFMDSFKSQITNSNPLLGKMDNLGDEKFYAFKYFIDQKVEIARREGKDISELYNPNSNEFLGKYVSQFQPTKDEQRAARRRNMRGPVVGELPGYSAKPVDPNAPAAPPAPPTITRKNGESAADFLKRKKASQ